MTSPSTWPALPEATHADFGWPLMFRPAPLRERVRAARRSLHQSLNAAGEARRALMAARYPYEVKREQSSWSVWMDVARSVRAAGISYSPLLPREMAAMAIPGAPQEPAA